jgi:dynein heavy chain
MCQVSKACTSICQWVRAMHKYHFVAKGVEPKRQALRIAQEDLAQTMAILDAAKKRLRDVEQGVAMLQAKYNECVAKKQELEIRTKECEARLVRADKVYHPSDGDVILFSVLLCNYTACLIKGYTGAFSIILTNR